MNISLEFILDNTLNTIIKKEDYKPFVKAVFGEKGEIDWGELAFKLDAGKQKYEFVSIEDLNNSLIYWPSYEYGLSNIVGQLVFVNYNKRTPIKKILTDLKLAKDYGVEGKGRWCWWGEFGAIFYDSFEDLVEYWLREPSLEPDPDETKAKIDKIGINKIKKEIESSNKSFDSLEELVDSI